MQVAATRRKRTKRDEKANWLNLSAWRESSRKRSNSRRYLKDDAYGGGEILHAFRVTLRATNGYVYPASHRAGSTTGALPMGARLRLKASRDLSGFTPPVRRIFRAMQTYGLIVADNGSDMYVSGTFDTRWNNDVLNPAFRALTAADFEVVELGYRPAPALAPPNELTHRRSLIRILYLDYSLDVD